MICTHFCFLHRFPVILINRLILYLREYCEKITTDEGVLFRSTYPKVVYAQNPFLGNLGAPLRSFEEDEPQDEPGSDRGDVDGASLGVSFDSTNVMA